MRVTGDQWHVPILLVFEANFPARKQLRPGLDVGEFWILKRTLQLSSNDVFEAVVGYDVMSGALVLDGNGLLHEAALLELVAIDERTAETSLLFRGQTLSKVCIDFTHGLHGRNVASGRGIKGRIVVFILGVVDVIARLGDGRGSALFALSLAATGWIQSRALLLGLEGSNELTVDQAVVHHTTWGPMDGIGPSFDARCVLLVHEDGARSEHLGSFFVVRSTADVTKTTLQRGFYNGHGIFSSVEKTVPGWLESWLGLHHGACSMGPLGGRPSRIRDVRCDDGVVPWLHASRNRRLRG